MPSTPCGPTCEIYGFATPQDAVREGICCSGSPCTTHLQLPWRQPLHLQMVKRTREPDGCARCIHNATGAPTFLWTLVPFLAVRESNELPCMIHSATQLWSILLLFSMPIIPSYGPQTPLLVTCCCGDPTSAVLGCGHHRWQPPAVWQRQGSTAALSSAAGCRTEVHSSFIRIALEAMVCLRIQLLYPVLRAAAGSCWQCAGHD